MDQQGTNCTNISGECGTSAPDISHQHQQPQSDLEPAIAVFLDQSRFWVQRVLVPIITAIGVVGNTITIVIMTRRRMRSSTNIYLAALATFDMLYLILILFLSFSHYPNSNGKEFYFYWRVWPFVLMITDVCSNTSVWLTVTFTIERYIAVGFPIRRKVLCTESRAKKVILTVSFICFTLTLPTPFEWTILEGIDRTTNRTVMLATYSDLGNNHLYRTIYYWLTIALFIVIPFCLLAIFNAFLIRSVHLSKRTRKSMTRREELRESWRQENKITIMLIAVVMLFFFCQLPTAATLLYTSLTNVEQQPNEGALVRGLGNIFNFLMAINAAGNFVLYCLLSQKYRRTFLQTFCPCLKGKISRLHSVYQNTMFSNVDNGSPSVVHKNTVRLLDKNHRFDIRPSSIKLDSKISPTAFDSRPPAKEQQDRPKLVVPLLQKLNPEHDHLENSGKNCLPLNQDSNWNSEI